MLKLILINFIWCLQNNFINLIDFLPKNCFDKKKQINILKNNNFFKNPKYKKFACLLLTVVIFLIFLIFLITLIKKCRRSKNLQIQNELV